MNIEIRDPELQARLQKQLQATGSQSVEEPYSTCLIPRKNKTAGSWKIASYMRPKFSAAWTNSIAAKESRKSN